MEKTKTTWEELCERGRIARREYDKWRWVIGDLALEVQMVYGEDKLADFARETGFPKKTVQNYRTISLWYTKSTRGDFFDTFPDDVITWSHYREAARLNTTEESWAILEQAAANGWTTDQLAREVGILLGNSANERVYLAKEVEGYIVRLIGGKTEITVTLPLDAIFQNGDTVKVSVWR